MLNIIFYFQVHQPYRLKHINVLDIGNLDDYSNDTLNGMIMKKVAEKCYLPSNRLMLEMIRRYSGKFKIAYSISGIAIEQFRKYSPEVLESFRELASTGDVEFLNETYYHSLSSLQNRDEFLDQILMHRALMQSEFNVTPTVFRNTELIYSDKISDIVAEEGFKVMLTEGVDRILKWRTPLYSYKNYSKSISLLLKYYSLSDDIAFRFSNTSWQEYPLTVEKFINWIDKLTISEKEGRNLFLNLFMDYETFGEHQWEETGIFNFMAALPEAVLKHSHLGFAHPSELGNLSNYQQESISFPEPVSWADQERDLSAWLENDMQKNAHDTIYELLEKIKMKQRDDLLHTARLLTTSDHFYYMCTKYFQDGDVHKYFSPYDSPEQAYIYYINALADLEEKL